MIGTMLSKACIRTHENTRPARRLEGHKCLRLSPGKPVSIKLPCFCSCRCESKCTVVRIAPDVQGFLANVAAAFRTTDLAEAGQHVCVCLVNAQVLNKHVNTWATKSTKPFTCMEALRAYMFVAVRESVQLTVCTKYA